MRHLLLVVSLAAAVLIGLACEHDPEIAPDPVAPVTAETGAAAKALGNEPLVPEVPPVEEPQYTHDEDLHELLSEHFEFTENFKRFEATITPSRGGVVHGEMVSWHAGCFFEINIPPDAIPGTDPVTISIDVPEYDQDLPPEDGPPAVFRFLPHGLRFNKPIIVVLTYPWWCTFESKRFRLYYIDDMEEAPGHYEWGRGPEFWAGGEVVEGEHTPNGEIPHDPVVINGMPPYFESWSDYLAICSGLRFEIQHFSRWKTVNGGGDGKDGWPWDDVVGSCEPKQVEPQTLPVSQPR